MLRYVVHFIGDDHQPYWKGFKEKARADELFESLGKGLLEYYLEDIKWEEGETSVSVELERYWPPPKK